jgi:hypothetical protein
MKTSLSMLEKYRQEKWRAEGKDSLINDLLTKYGDKEEGY